MLTKNANNILTAMMQPRLSQTSKLANGITIKHNGTAADIEGMKQGIDDIMQQHPGLSYAEATQVWYMRNHSNGKMPNSLRRGFHLTTTGQQRRQR